MDATKTASAPGSDAHTETTHQFEFTGSGAEYFRIWLVNVLLTVATLGIYSAWAKVRNLRYLYGNTRVAGAGFDYHANPIAILKGRLIAVAVLLVYGVVISLIPAIEPVLTLALIGIIPWIVARALRFRYVNSSYRAVRFGFDGRYWGIFGEFIAMPLLMIFTLGLIWPYLRFRQRRYLVRRTRYGRTGFDFHGTSGAWFVAAAITLLIFSVGIAVLFASALPAISPAEQEQSAETLFFSIVIGFFAFVLITLFAGDYFRARTRNLLFNHTSLEGRQFISTMTPGGLFGVSMLNALLVFATMGLATPWAVVRLARYNARTLQLKARGDLGAFASAQGTPGEAFGDEFGDMIDLDIGA